jgi:hypothetical protein
MAAIIMVYFYRPKKQKKLTPISNITDILMDLNHLELPASLVADLYKSSLIETDQLPAKLQPEKIETGTGWKYLGNNGKNILILVKYDNSVHLPDEQLSFLINMLSACKIGVADVAIMNLNNHPEASYKELLDHFKSKIVFLYGVEPAVIGLPISFPHFQVQSFSNCTFLFTPGLEELDKDKVLKSKLWVCLRRIFAV